MVYGYVLSMWRNVQKTKLKDYACFPADKTAGQS